ncbi:MAG: ParB/RepB/Spo0J family partition protein [Terriglobales bacterium]
MTSSNAAVDKTPAGTEKGHDKLAEKRRALGRGLESLLPGPRVVAASTLPVATSAASTSSTPTLPQSARKDGAPSADFQEAAPLETVTLQAGAVDGEHAFELELDQIEQNPYQTRTEFDQRALAELAASILVQGVLQPIVVRPVTAPVGKYGYTTVGGETVRAEAADPDWNAPAIVGAGGKERYVLILGERRFRASKLAGKTTIPAIVKRVSAQQAAEMTLVENLQRQDLGCLDQAEAFSKLSTQFSMTQDEIGKRVGVSREQVSNYMRLLSLPIEVQAALRNKELSYSHARLLLALEGAEQIVKVARVAIARKMSVALLEELVMDSHVPKADPQPSGARWVDPNVRAAQRSLEVTLGMRVRIRDRKGKGKITIEYGTLEDFDRVVGMLKGKA